jgi:hypothetical protein
MFKKAVILVFLANISFAMTVEKNDENEINKNIKIYRMML